MSSIYRIVDRGEAVELRGPGAVMTVTGDDAEMVRAWQREARRWVPKGKAWEHIVVNYVEHMATEEGWLA